MPNFTAGTSFTDGVTNDVTAAKLNALIADAVPTSSLSLNSTTGTIANFTSSTANITLGTIPTLTAGTTTGTAATFTSGTITTGVIPTLTSTTLITSGTGTAASPAIQPTGDTNTGIFFPAADTIAFSEGGTESMRIDSSGRVGIGETAPGSILHVTNKNLYTGKLTFGGMAATGTVVNNEAVGNVYSEYLLGTWNLTRAKIRAEAGTGGGDGVGGGVISLWTGASDGVQTERLRIDSSGNVGIGTSPSDILHVSKANGVSIFESTGISSVGIRLRTNATDRWQIGCPSASADLAIYTGAAATERLRIDSSGRVGIGMTPAALLDISKSDNTGAVTDFPALRVTNTNSTQGNGTSTYNYARIDIKSGNGTVFGDFGTRYDSLYSGAYIGTESSHPVLFQTGGTERLRITSGGNVEIGATGKSAKLLVQSEAGNSQCVYFIHDTALEDVLSLASTPTSGNNMFIQFYTEANAATSRGYIDYNRGSSVVRYSTTSDETLKNIIGDSSGEESVNILKNTKIRDFTWKNDTTNKVNVGVIAQELYNVFKGAVSVGGDIVKKDSDGNDVTTYQPWGVDKTAFTFHLVAGWQAHEKLIQELKSENDSLKARITALEAA